MRRTQKFRTMTVFYSLLFSFLFSLLLFSSQAQASGAKRPELGTEEATVINEDLPDDSVSSPDDGSVNTPSVPTAPASDYAYLDPQKLVPKTLLAKTLDYFLKNKTKIKNQNYIVVIDFKQHSSKERFYLIDMETGHVETYLTAHGKNSDPNYTGYATQFSNEEGSLMSSVGYYLTAETYYGSKGFSLKLDGLSSTNSNARSRAIVIHGAAYVTPGSIIGRSWGCPALEERYNEEVINKIKGGALIYAASVY